MDRGPPRRGRRHRRHRAVTTVRRALAIGAGGVAGAALRWWVATTFVAHGFPWPVFAINVAGSFVLGVLLAEEWTHPRTRLLLHDVGGIGFCGGLTTFSAYAVAVVNLSRDGHAATAAGYAIASVVAAVAAVILGAAAMGQLRSLTLPLEEAP